MSTAPIVVEHLTRRFGDFTAVDDISFSVGEGEVFGWLGPNGAGKTTTIRMLLGLVRPTSGRALVLGLDSARQTKAMHARVGYMTQQFTLYGDLTAWQNIRFYAGVYGLSGAAMRQRIPEIIRMAGLEGREGALTSALSGGWKQRLALGCAIVHRPRVLFLDEPTAGVDPISRREFWALIYAMAEEGVTVLVTTHYMDEAELCGRIGLVDRGRLVALDTPEGLRRTQMSGEVLEVISDQPELALRMVREAAARGELNLAEAALYGATVHAVVPDAARGAAEVARALAAGGIAPRSVARIEPTLEDVFVAAVGRRPASG